MQGFLLLRRFSPPLPRGKTNERVALQNAELFLLLTTA